MGAGSFGPLYNFDFSKAQQWLVAKSVTGMSNNDQLTQLISSKKVVLDSSLFYGVGNRFGNSAGNLNLKYDSGRLILEYTPQENFYPYNP